MSDQIFSLHSLHIQSIRMISVTMKGVAFNRHFEYHAMNMTHKNVTRAILIYLGMLTCMFEKKLILLVLVHFQNSTILLILTQN